MTIKDFIEAAKRNYMRDPQEWIHTHYESLDGYYTNIVSKGVAYQPRVSSEDLPTVSPYRWYLKDGYAVTSIAGKRVRMHHLVFGKPPEGKEVDHINRDRLDNRRSNLRFVSRTENAQNMRSGGHVRQRGKKWEAYIQANRKQIHLGMFDTEAEASEAYTKARLKYHVI